MKNSTGLNKQTNTILRLLGEELDISDAKYKEAEDRYNAIGKWLSRPESKVRSFSPDIYVQGSFRLGTAIKPTTEDGEYDIDSVCKLELTTTQCTQEQLKQLIGFEIKAYAKAQSMAKPVEEGKRCWTLIYADGSKFHMDILPAIPNAERFRQLLNERNITSEWTDDAISITDNTHLNYSTKNNDWPVSNPKGYAEWFSSCMKVATTRNFAGMKILRETYANVEDVPTHQFKTPLQRAIQIIKRHRDTMYGDSDDKPISIIITTLAAHAYDNEADVIDALSHIVDNMLNYIGVRNSEKWIGNPANPLENFADKWPTHPQREKEFYRWHAQLQKHVQAINSSQTGLHNFSKTLREMVGEPISIKVMESFGNSMKLARENKTLKASKGAVTLGVAAGTTVKSHTFYGS
jgi:hypothetical protein